MRRREFITLASGAAAAWPLAAPARQAGGTRRIGALMNLTANDPEDRARVAAFRDSLRQLGWIEGRNLLSEYRWYAGDVGRARTLAKELVDQRPDLIFVAATPGTAAILAETQTIPVVFVVVSDPVDQGLVSSLARPGGNATGFAFSEYSVGTKLLEALKQIAPGVTRIAIFYNPDTSARFSELYLRPIEAAGPGLGVELIRAPVHDAAGVESAFAAVAQGGRGGVLCLPDTFLSAHYRIFVELAARYELPAVYGARLFVAGGGLMSYAVNVVNQFRQSASYVHRILQGEKPADLPVQLPTSYDLVINNKTAKALGIEVPLSLLIRVDEVIE